MRQLRIFLAAAIAVTFLASAAMAHDCFKDPFTEYYGFKSVSCKTCHPDSKKKHHNRFGIMYVKELDGLELTKKWKALEGKDEERAKYEEEMVKEFKKILPNVEGNQMTVKALLAAGIINGTRLEKPDDGSEAGAVTLKEYEKELKDAEEAAAAAKKAMDKDADKKDMKKDDKKNVMIPFGPATPTSMGGPVLSRLSFLAGAGILVLFAFVLVSAMLLMPKKSYVTS